MDCFPVTITSGSMAFGPGTAGNMLLPSAKWESGMDNAVRFDRSQIVQNGPAAWSLNQESVDLNSFLFAEKNILGQLATVLGKRDDSVRWDREAAILGKLCRKQFYNQDDSWFYDTNLSGTRYIRDRGSEGWLPLWAGLADNIQAAAVRELILDQAEFNTFVPLPTLSAAHPDFKPDGGYWRGPVWLDQFYFGIKGLHNYGYHKEADALTKKLLENASGLLAPGPAIRENYHPLTGAGLEAQNFSWSAGHLLLLLLE